MTLYTHDKAADMVEILEDCLIKNNISVPSPEDEEREPDDKLGLYGSTYSELLDKVENELALCIQLIKISKGRICHHFETLLESNGVELSDADKGMIESAVLDELHDFYRQYDTCLSVVYGVFSGNK